MFKFIKKLFKKKEPEEDFEIVEEEEKTKQEVIYSKEKEERTRLNYRTIMLTGTSIEKLTETIDKTDTKIMPMLIILEKIPFSFVIQVK